MPLLAIAKYPCANGLLQYRRRSDLDVYLGGFFRTAAAKLPQKLLEFIWNIRANFRRIQYTFVEVPYE